MNKNIVNIIKYVLFLSIGVVLLYFAFKDIPIDTFIDSVKQADFFWVGMNILFGLIAFVSRAIRWKIAIEPLGYNVSKLNTFYALMVGYLANMAFPRLGEVTRCSSLYKTDKVPVSKLLGTVIVERALDLTILLSIMVFVFFYNIELFGNFILEKILDPVFNTIINKFGSAGIAYAIIGGVFISIIIAIYLFRKKLLENAIVNKILALLKDVLDGVKTIYKMEKKLYFVFHTIVIWVFYTLMTYAVFFALKETSELTFADALFVLVFGGIGMSLPVQGGFGTYHAIVALALTIYGIPYEIGLVYATISHEAQTLLVLVVGGFSAIMVSIHKRKDLEPQIILEHESKESTK